MKEIVLKLYEFDDLSKDSQERIIERERWNVMEQCMDAYDIDYKKSMEAFEDLTDTKVYGWEVGYERYDFSYEFKYNDPIYEHPTDYNRDIFPKNLCDKLLFRYINNNIMPHITKGKYYSTGKYIDGKYNYKCRRSRVILGYEDNCPLTGMCYDYYLLKPIIDYYDTWKEQDFINRYKNVQESIVKAMDKALERAIGNKVIDFEKCEGNYLDVYPLIGAVLQKELRSVLGENVNKSISRNMKIKATKYRSDYRVWLDYAGDYRNENIE